jgi:polysaccharide export outer membrane protein
MNEHFDFREIVIPRLSPLQSARRAFLLPLGFFILTVACGGGTKSADVAVPADDAGILEVEEPYIAEFVLGAGDELAIRVWGHDDLSRKINLDITGEFYYPFVGYVNAGGMGIKQLRQTINDGLSRYYVNPQVGIEVVALRSQKIFVLGEVRRPGVFVFDGSNTAIEAISGAGGFTEDSNKSSVILIRGDIDDPYLQRLNLQDLLVKGKVEENIILQAGDVLYVPRSFVGDVREFFRTMQIVIRPIVLLERAIVLEPRVEDVFLE